MRVFQLSLIEWLLIVFVIFLAGFLCGNLVTPKNINIIRQGTGLVFHDFKEPELLTISREVASMREYNYPVWDCSEMSRELVRRLFEKGYMNPKLVHGCFQSTSQRGNHDWVEVTIWIEATTGRIINPKKHNSYQIGWCEDG
jgi:hypothetical protein